MENAIDKIIAGVERDRLEDPEQIRTVAYHECGHAVTAWFLEEGAPLLKLSIVPRSGGSLGFAQYLPNED